jgi:hypothetical protein
MEKFNKLPHNRTAQKAALYWTRHCVARLWAGRYAQQT